jgi:hypothetical protein
MPETATHQLEGPDSRWGVSLAHGLSKKQLAHPFRRAILQRPSSGESSSIMAYREQGGSSEVVVAGVA